MKKKVGVYVSVFEKSEPPCVSRSLFKFLEERRRKGEGCVWEIPA